MSGGDFIDSNVFVYTFDLLDDEKRNQAQKTVRAALNSGTGVISYQVVQETLNVLTRKIKTPVSDDLVLNLVERVMQPMWRVMPSVGLFKSALHNQSRYALSFYDALIVAAAQEAGCKRLYSEDMQHGQAFGKLKIVNPFVV
ncbi:MAG: PIN domain-containing protein [Casimicrobium sp.]